MRTYRTKRPPDLPRRPASGLNSRDYLTIAFSSLALLVSSTTAYFNVIRVVDELSFVPANLPELEIGEDGELALSSSQLSVVFINSGSRPAVISSFYISLSQLRPNAPRTGEECLDELQREDRTKIFKTDASVIVLREREAASKRVQLSSANSASPRLAISRAPFNETADSFQVVLCFDVDAATMSNTAISTYRTVKRWEVRQEAGRRAVVPAASFPGQDRPVLLYRRVGSILSE